MVRNRVRNVPLGRGGPTARPEHMLALKEGHLTRIALQLLNTSARLPAIVTRPPCRPLHEYHVPHRANVLI